jgi:4-hydroxybenzoate polyprenyltransferase
MTTLAPPVAVSAFAQYYALTKPRVIQLIVFCALIGMVLAVPGVPSWREVGVAAMACVGIWLVAGAAAAFNCIIEKSIDAKMKRTAWRPTAKGELGDWQTLLFSATLCTAGSGLLYFAVNPLTMWLTFATFIGYAVIYTVILKPMTPQNIVIGGASGAMPPVLGWAAMAGNVGPEAIILFLIIFLATALLGTGPVPGGGLPQVRPADAARDPRQRVHPVDGAALHLHPACGVSAAFHLWHEFLAVPGGRGGAERRLHLACLVVVARLF